MRRPKVKLDNLLAFMTVAARHNINIDDAADELGLSAFGVRKQLDNIENTFDIRLFQSIRGSLILTVDGKLFHKDARKAGDLEPSSGGWALDQSPTQADRPLCISISRTRSWCESNTKAALHRPLSEE